MSTFTTETSRLLSDPTVPEEEYGIHDNSDDSTTTLQDGYITTTADEASAISKSSLSLIITFFLQYSLNVVSIFSVGHIGKTELAAVSLSAMTFNISAGVFQGMATSLDTFCSQAYGAGKMKLVGLHFQRCVCMVFVIAIPINLMWWFSASILNLFVPDKDLTSLAQNYLRILAFGSPGFILFETGKRFLQAQGNFHGAKYVLYICTPINAVLNYVLVWDSSVGIGFYGAALATAVSYTLMAFLLLCYAAYVDGSKCWNGLQIRESCKNWGPMASLALPGVIMIEAEFLAFEILTLSAAKFGTETLAAQSIASTCASLVFQVPFGLSVAACTRVATYIGSQNVISAQIAIKVSLIIALILGVVLASSVYNGKDIIISWFTDDSKVIEQTLVVIQVLAYNQLFDTVNVISAGCLRAQGRQKIGSNLNLFCYYAIGLPMAMYLAFHRGWGLKGLWFGLSSGVFVLAIAELIAIFTADWEWIVRKSIERNSVEY